jgi:tetratricopeptide (TPR) repeat protein
MKQNEWLLGRGDILSVIGGDPTGEVRAETRRKVLRLVSNEKSIRLLYRLSVIGTSFNTDLVRDIGRVNPTLNLPMELVNELVGPWITKESEDLYRVIPLLSKVGDNVLDEREREAVHEVIGIHFLRGPIDFHEASFAIIHLTAGKAWDILTQFLIGLITQIDNKAYAEPLSFVLFLKFLDEVPKAFRILIRAVQVRLAMLLGEDIGLFIEDIESLIEDSDDEVTPAHLFALLIIGPYNMQASPVDVAQRLLEICNLTSRHFPDSGEIKEGLCNTGLIWICADRIETHEEINEILNTIEKMDDEYRVTAFTEDDLPFNRIRQMRRFVDKCWTLEKKKPEDERDWDKVLDLIDRIIRVSELPGAKPLWSLAIQAKAIVITDQYRRPQEAVELLEQSIETESLTIADLFILHDVAGCILFDQSDFENALVFFQKAIDRYSCDHLCFHTHKFAAESAAKLSKWELSRELILRSLSSLTIEDDPFDKYRAVGELAFAHWNLGNKRKACRTLAYLLNKLKVDEYGENDDVTQLIHRAFNLLMWMDLQTQFEGRYELDQVLANRREPYPGCFFEKAVEYVPNFNSLVFYELGEFASICGLLSLAERSYSQALDWTAKSDKPIRRERVDWSIAKIAALQGDFDKAIEYGLSGIRHLGIDQLLRERGEDILNSQASSDDLWREISDDQRANVERILIWVTFLPIVVQYLSEVRSETEITRDLQALLDTILQAKDRFEDIEYWEPLINDCVEVLNSMTDVRDFRAKVAQEQSVGNSSLLPILYLIVGRVENLTMGERCLSHSIVVMWMVNSGYNHLMIRLILEYIGRYWKNIAENQAFSLRNPRPFRAELRNFTSYSPSDIAQILLSASAATEAVIEESIVTALRDLVISSN